MNSNLFFDIIKLHIETKKIEFKSNDLKNVFDLEKLGVISKHLKTPELFELNLNSPALMGAVLDYAEKKLNEKLPTEIFLAFEFTERFREFLKIEQDIKTNVINAYSSLIRGLKSYCLIFLSKKGINVKEYYLHQLSLEEGKEISFSELQHSFFDFLAHSDETPEETWNILITTVEKSDEYYVRKYTLDLPLKQPEIAQSLYEYSKNLIENEYKYLTTNLLIGFNKVGEDLMIKDAFELLQLLPEEGLRAFSAIDVKGINLLKSIYSEVTALSEEKLLNQISRVLVSIIENEDCSSELRKECFDKLASYLKSEEEDSVNAVFSCIMLNLENFEKEKYQLLYAYLEKTKNFKVLKNFFWKFKNPIYLFDLIVQFYRSGWQRRSMSLFEDAISHFWKINQSKTEKLILELFDPKFKFGLLPVEIIMTGRFSALSINLLGLDTKEKQAKAIDVICLFPHSFDRLLPTLLVLRKSPFPEVIKFLQIKLSELIYEAYHKTLLDDILKTLEDSQEDKKFSKPLKEIYGKYEELKKLKTKVLDLSPYENERELMDLYYRLDRENQAEIMSDDEKKPSSLSSLFGKKTIIVRANSWKQELEDEVRPLGKIETSMLLDARLFKNPDLQEFILNNYDKS